MAYLDPNAPKGPVLPTHLEDMALMLRGNVRSGIFSKVQLPTFARKTETIHPPGTSHPFDVDLGPEGPAIMALDSTELEPLILQDYGICNGRQARIHLKSAYKHSLACQYDKHEVIATGMWKEIDLGTQEKGTKTDRKYTLSCRTFSIAVNGRVLLSMDALAINKAVQEILGI